jgi:rod shape-determining protein MreD
VRLFDVVIAILLAFVLQTVAARYVPFLAAHLDLFVVVAAGFGLARGRMSGMVAGAAAGLLQDAFSGGLLGYNGISKTTVGYLSGIVGRHLIIRGFSSRVLFFVLATMLDMGILAAVGYVAELPRVVGEGFTPLYLCIGNAIAGILLVRVLDRHPQGDVS